MKVQFNHQLEINYSRVIEVLSLACVLNHESDHKDVQDLSVFHDISMTYKSFFDWLRPYPRMRFAWLEFAILSIERQDVDAFIKDIKQEPLEQLFVTFLGYDISLDDAKRALSSKEEGISLALSLGFDVTFSEVIISFSQVISAFFDVLNAIDGHPAFNESFNECLNLNEYAGWIERFQRGLTDRHPLSYAQELMGKPFWNIADYKAYEFVPVYFISPYSMRLMNGEKMIYIQGLRKRGKSPEERLETILDPLKSMADGTRLRILRMLYMRPMYGKEIADALGLTTATVSHHLEALSQQGLINLEKVKQIKYFSTNHTQLGRKLDDVARYIRESE